MLLGISNPISSEDEGNMKIMTFVSRPYDTAWITGNNRPKFVNRANVKSPDVAQVGEMLYYFSAGFLTFEQWDFTSCLNADRPLLRLECRVAARVRLMAASGTWNPSCVAEAQMRTSILVLSLSNRAGENIA